ncbi:MAG: hypothetical protein AAF543_13370 [Pseudomonadota bacterium]
MRFSKTSRSAAWLIIMALLVQPWLGQRALAKASGTLNALVICTGTGFEVIRAPADAQLPAHPADAPGDHDASAVSCLACLVETLDALEGAGRIEPPSLHRYWVGEARIIDPWIAESLCHRSLGGRGPPSI